jgi:hypothetical protein
LEKARLGAGRFYMPSGTGKEVSVIRLIGMISLFELFYMRGGRVGAIRSLASREKESIRRWRLPMMGFHAVWGSKVLEKITYPPKTCLVFLNLAGLVLD